MKIHELYESWQDSIKAVEKAKGVLASAISDANAEEKRLHEAIYEKRDSHLRHYKEYLIQSGSHIFSFDFTGKNRGSAGIENFKEINYLSLDDE